MCSTSAWTFFFFLPDTHVNSSPKHDRSDDVIIVYRFRGGRLGPSLQRLRVESAQYYDNILY